MSNPVEDFLRVTREFLFGDNSHLSKTELTYLNQSVDAVDLEYRMKQLERNRNYLRY